MPGSGSYRLVLCAVLLGIVWCVPASTALPQESGGIVGESLILADSGDQELSAASAKVDISPVARDEGFEFQFAQLGDALADMCSRVFKHLTGMLGRDEFSLNSPNSPI